MALTLSADELNKLPVGKGTCLVVEGKKLIAYRGAAAGDLKIAANSCAHLGKPFAPDIEDSGIMQCTAHAAKLDPATMLYTSGPSRAKGVGTKVEQGHAQPVYTVTMNADGSASLVAPPAGGSCCTVC